MANVKFLTGTRTIPVGATDLAVTGLSLTFTPVSVSVNVRQPSASADFIHAQPVGSLTTSGFSVTFSAPPSSADYLLDFTVFGEGINPVVDADALAVSYTDLKNAVATFLGYDVASLTTAQLSAVDSYIQSGVRNFYYPPAMNGVDPNFEWSFIRQDGSVQTSANVSSYRLPDGTGRVLGQLVVQGDAGPTIPVVSVGELMAFQQRGLTGRPKLAAVSSENNFGDKGQTKRLLLFPTPDKAYTLKFRCDADTGKIDATNHPFPLGGSMYGELITESCLAVAEQRANDEVGLHTQNFNQLLVSMIQRDRKSTAQNFGRVSHERIWN